MLPQENFRLKLFGSGPFVEKLKTKYTKKDSRIQYMELLRMQKWWLQN